MMTIKKLLALLIFLQSISGFSSTNGYWQQAVDYKMEIDFDHQTHRFAGIQTIQYTNNSPDTLYRVFYHLYFNAFQPGSEMDVRSRTISDPDSRIADRISNLNDTEIGFHKINKLLQNGKEVTHKISGTIMEVILADPIYPKTTSAFRLEFISQVPVQIRRSGRNNAEGVDYTMTQWYPKMAEYDRHGWHTDPYIGREFHGVFGNFDVDITIDSKYVLAGTGVVQNPDEVGHGYSDNKPRAGKLTWKFKADQVHDFAWAADPDYVHSTKTMADGTVLRFFHLNDTTIAQNWKNLEPATILLFEIMNAKFGQYPYPQFSVIQGGDGGMEYPMCTMIVGGGSFGGLVSVTVHEAIHSWYYGVLATNESKYPWMDEGFTTFAQNIVLDSIFKRGNVNPHWRSHQSYINNALSGAEEPLTTHADFYLTNRSYGTNSYSKGCVFLTQIQCIVGKKAFFEGMNDYYNNWKFKHPEPADFIRVMEYASGMELDWFSDLWIGTTRQIDYAIEQVIDNGKNSVVRISRKGEIPMPLEIEIITKSGKHTYYIPLELMRGTKPLPSEANETWSKAKPWPWTYPAYDLVVPIKMKNIDSVTIDPNRMMADVNPENNSSSSGVISFPSE